MFTIDISFAGCCPVQESPTHESSMKLSHLPIPTPVAGESAALRFGFSTGYKKESMSGEEDHKRHDYMTHSHVY